MKIKTIIKLVIFVMFLVVCYDTLFVEHAISIHARYVSLLDGSIINCY